MKTRFISQSFIRPLVCLGVLAIPVMAWAGPEMNYGLSLNGDLWGNAFSSQFNFDNDWGLSGMNMNLSGPSLNAQAGDVSANWDQLSLAGRSFQGISTGFGVGKVDLSLLGGTVVLQPDYVERQLGDLLERLQPPVVSPIYGVRASIPLSNKFDVSASQLMTPNASDTQGKGISTLAFNYKFSRRQRLGLEMAHSSGGNGWQLSGSTEGKRLKFQASYRQADTGFSSAGNPTLIRRRNGGFLNGSYRLSKPLTITTNLQRYNDGGDGRTDYNSLVLRYTKKKQPSVNLFWRSAKTQRSLFLNTGSGSTPVSTSSTSVGFRIVHRLGVNRVSLQAERLQFKSTSSFAANGTTNRFSLGLSRPLGKKTDLSLYQILDLGSTNRTAYTSLNLSHRLGKSGLTVDLGIQYVNRSATNVSGQALSVRPGLRYVFHSGNSISLQYQGDVYGSGSLGIRSTGQVYVGYSHNFGGGSGRRQNLSLQQRRELGKVSGRVFEDSNGNGYWDKGEPGVADVSVNIIGGAQQHTDTDGRFSMAEMRPGKYLFGLETKTLPIQYTTLNPDDVPVQVIADKSVTFEIPVVRTGQAQGIVFQDTNRNGVRDEGEQGVPNAIVKVTGSDTISFTDSQGQFTLHGLAPKKWQIAVDTSVMSEDIKSTGTGIAEIIVPPNGIISGIELGVAPVEKSVVDTFAF